MTDPSPYNGSPTVLLTNDDGLKGGLLEDLAQKLSESGLDVTVVAPGRDRSACSLSLTLFDDLALQRHGSLERPVSPGRGALRVFTVNDGTPADCVAAALVPGSGVLARLGLYPRMCVSGINAGPNLGTDVLYSGTFAGARQAAISGVPALAVSLATYKKGLPAARAGAVRAAVRLTLLLLGRLPPGPPPGRTPNTPAGKDVDLAGLFARGDVIVNANAPVEWGGRFATTGLDWVTYAVNLGIENLPERGDDKPIKFSLKDAKCVSGAVKGSDTEAVKAGQVAVSTLQTWPCMHALAVDEGRVREGLVGDEEGLPVWMGASEAAKGKRAAAAE